MSLIYLAEIQSFNLITNAVETLRFCSGQGYNDDTNPMSGIYYEPRIEQPALLSYEMFNDLKMGGQSSVGYGELTLVNIDGALDYLNAYAFDGRELVIKFGDDQASYSSFITVFKGVIAYAVIEYALVSFRIRDKSELLQRPLQTLTYAGNNSLPNGLEGDNSLTGKLKPLVFGECKNLTPVLVNTSRLIYQVSSVGVTDIPKVYDKGVELSYAGTYSSQSDMETNAPSAGSFKVWLAGGMFRLGSSAAGGITCDVIAADRYLSETLITLLTSDNGIDASDIVMADFSGMAADTYIIDFYASDSMSIADAVDAVCSSVGVCWWFDELGQFRCVQFSMDFTGPVATLTDVEILSIDRYAAIINSKPYNAWNIKLGHEKNWTVQKDDQLAASVTQERRAWLGKEYRYISQGYSFLKTYFLMAQEVTLDSCISKGSDAVIQISHLLNLWADKTHFYDVALYVDAYLLSVIKLNTVLIIDAGRFGGAIEAKVISIKTDYQRQQLELKLLGY
jgi:hypothetical protein